jgi:squalene-hopene/tetraprenyl-beta-curcumene cyclase
LTLPRFSAIGLAALFMLTPVIGQAADPQPNVQQSASKAIEFLKTKGQAEDGAFTSVAGTGVTSIAAYAMLRNGLPSTDPAVAKAVKWVLDHQQKDGGIYVTGSKHRNYETALATLMIAEANKSGEYDALLKKADGFLKGIQWAGEVSDTAYGGGGYGSHSRPDLSNTSFLIDALKATGNDDDSDAIQRALIFVSRAQNLETEHNQTKFASLNPDGGFYYTPAAGGSSQAGETPNGGLRSYASMTYAGLKSMLYAGVGPDDKRVKAAMEWISKNYSLEENPGLGSAGQYYYYHIFAKALDATGKDIVVDASGEKHNWRKELAAELISRQQADGSWINQENERWLEGDANLVTSYALLALAYCQEK